MELSMSEPAQAAALARRYDGPIPPLASLPPDFDSPWPDRLENRRRWAWADVREVGHRMARARRAFAETSLIAHHREWVRLRRCLARSIHIWAAYRDLSRAETRRPR
jgi:hypothetical protein